MRWNLSHPVVGGLLVAVAIGVISAGLGSCAPPAPDRPRAEDSAPAEEQQPAKPHESPAPTIESSGEVLGVAIGMPMADARAKLDPLRAPGPAYEPDAKELQSRRIMWRLEGTDYAWVMVWAGGDGKVTRVRAVLRPNKAKPFHEIGDLTKAAAADATSARWNLRRPDGPNYRLIAQGTEQQATSIYMFSLEIPIKERQEDDGAAEEP